MTKIERELSPSSSVMKFILEMDIDMIISSGVVNFKLSNSLFSTTLFIFAFESTKITKVQESFLIFLFYQTYHALEKPILSLEGISHNQLKH